ncbi:uncharacterized protein PgNI_02102 [Pyricularia grisea]|uniref:Uncharacterized protein n=1 Tax=Pyricularia grisea TaxID=148305 RepID=A0A6P8BM32_PYRGI|nr:uncharacterized protein PgNI_02102 [Pyricularia grisea]TLD17873.1 hypothetical protein PgNI_02102 [Pyricularia grisea]
MSLSIEHPVYTTRYIGPCLITLYDSNNQPVQMIDAPDNVQPVIVKVNNDRITININIGCKAERVRGLFSDGYYFEVRVKTNRTFTTIKNP